MKSLRRLLVVYVLLPVAALLAVLVGMTFASVENLLEGRLKKEIELVARSLRMPIEGALRDGDRDRLQEALGAVSEIGRVYGAAVYDAEGRRIAVTGEAMPGPAEQVRAAELVAVGEELGQYDDFAGRSVYSYFVPLSMSLGRIDALLQVVREESDIRTRLNDLRRDGIFVAVAGLVLVFGVLVLGHRQALIRPVRQLLADMRNVERGNRSWRARVQSPEELARVARGLNHMLDALDRAEQEVSARQAEEARLRERMRRQESQAALGRFSAGVAHELGAPLTVIQTDAQRLHQTASDSDSRRRLRRIGDQLSRTRQLVEQLMSLVREPEAEPERCDLAEIVSRAVIGAKPQAESRGLLLHCAVLERTPVTGLPVRVEHAVLNLVRNALQAARQRVEVHLQSDQGVARVVVEDDGPGLDPARARRVFEPFHSDRPPGRGTGLGLTIVRTVAELHGGRVEVERSRRLGGSCFVLRLPQAGTKALTPEPSA